MALPSLDSPQWQKSFRAFAWGMRSVATTVLTLVPRARRIVFVHGFGCGLLIVCLTATALGYGLAANLPQLFAAAILLLTPLAFLLSTARNCKQISDILALVLGLALYPVVSTLH